MTAPSTPVEHRKVSEAIDDRLARIWAVYSRVQDEALNLSLLAFAHYVLGAAPNAEYIGVEVTDQGGDSLVFDCIGVEDKNYLAWQREHGYLTSGLSSEVRDRTGQHYVEIRYDHPVMDDVNDDGETILSTDALTEYAQSIEERQLVGFDWFERIGSRHSGQGRIWLGSLLLSLHDTYEGFVGEALDPFPDPNDRQAVAAWLARETAPKEI